MTDPIKAKIIELVPEIKIDESYPSCSCGAGEPFGEYCKCKQVIPEYSEIRLADVLRAIEKAGGMYAVDELGFFMRQVAVTLETNTYSGAKKENKWNLTTDYDNQTQEVKDFIGKLLGV